MKPPGDSDPTAKATVHRRTFLASAAAATTAFTIVPRHVLGGQATLAPSDKLNIAAVGIGGMGKNNVGKCDTENIVALCDVDFELADPVFKKYPNARTYKDFRVMLDQQKDIDAVIVATPDHSHALIAMAAMERKKHVYVQKPLTHSVHEARLLTETARKQGVATQMGNQGHSGEGTRLLCEWVWDGAIGDIREAHAWTNRPVWPSGIELDRPKETPEVPPGLDWDLWLGPAAARPYHPTYHPAKWRAWWDFGTGALGDMACHEINMAFMGLDLRNPISFQAQSSGHNRDSLPRRSTVTYEFAANSWRPAVKLVWYDGGDRPPGELLDGRQVGDSGQLVVGDKGKLWGYGDLVGDVARKEVEFPRSPGHFEEWVAESGWELDSEHRQALRSAA